MIQRPTVQYPKTENIQMPVPPTVLPVSPTVPPIPPVPTVESPTVPSVSDLRERAVNLISSIDRPQAPVPQPTQLAMPAVPGTPTIPAVPAIPTVSSFPPQIQPADLAEPVLQKGAELIKSVQNVVLPEIEPITNVVDASYVAQASQLPEFPALQAQQSYAKYMGTAMQYVAERKAAADASYQNALRALQERRVQVERRRTELQQLIAQYRAEFQKRLADARKLWEERRAKLKI